MTILDKFKKINLTEIKRMVLDEEQENLELDFKTANPGNDKGKEADLKNFAESLSGFANSQGGLIIWGVDARKKNDTGVDCAKELKPIENPKVFISLLSRSESTIVSPPVLGVKHKAILEKNSTGYVVSYIPASNHLPHMVHKNETNAYYRRYGDSFKKAQHFEVVEMFNKKVVPDIDLEFEFSEQQLMNIDTRFILSPFLVKLVNLTNATIKFPFIKVYGDPKLRASYFGLDGNRYTPLERRHSSSLETFFYFGGANTVIYPKQKFDLDYLGAIGQSHEPIPIVEVIFEIGGEGMEIKTLKYRFDYLNKKVFKH
jgi:hypothetical protein